MIFSEKVNKVNRWLLAVFIVLQPVFELFLDVFGDRIFAVFGISIATILRYGIFAIICFLCVITNYKKKSTLCFLIYAVITVAFVVLQYINVKNFDFSMYYGTATKGIVNCALGASRYIIPIYIIFLAYILEFGYKQMKFCILIAAIFVSLHVVLTNIAGWDYISYGFGDFERPAGNILSWFTHKITVDNWRLYTSRGMFASGNTLSSFMAIVLPSAVYIALKDQRTVNFLVIFIQLISMILVSTRVSVYGGLVLFAVAICIWLFDVIFNKKKLSIKNVICLVLVISITAGILSVAPFVARVNGGEGFDTNYIENEDVIDEELQEEISLNGQLNKEQKIEYIKENYAVHSIPEYLVFDIYDYEYHADFWFDLMTEVEFEQRNNARKIKALILDDIITQKGNVLDNLVGIGELDIYPETDISAMYYYFGAIGIILFLLPYIAILCWSIIYLLIKFFKKQFNPMLYVLTASLGFILIASYAAGHTLSFLYINVFMGMICGILVKALICKSKTEEKDDEGCQCDSSCI